MPSMSDPQPVGDELGAPILGPGNVVLERENPGRCEFSSASSLQADRYEVLLAGGNRSIAVRILRDAGIPAADAA